MTFWWSTLTSVTTMRSQNIWLFSCCDMLQHILSYWKLSRSMFQSLLVLGKLWVFCWEHARILETAYFSKLRLFFKRGQLSSATKSDRDLVLIKFSDAEDQTTWSLNAMQLPHEELSSCSIYCRTIVSQEGEALWVLLTAAFTYFIMWIKYYIILFF